MTSPTQNSNTSDILGLPYIQAAQAQKHVTHNEALCRLDHLVQLSVEDLDRQDPPAAPDAGARHIVGANASGIWAGQEGAIAIYGNGAWSFEVPLPGWVAYVRALGKLVVYDGSSWSEANNEPPIQTTLFGINAAADETNRFVVSSDATLFNHSGAGHQLKLNKSQSTDTASLLYQTGYSGRAEMGLAGNDDFGLKVSADGSAWKTALSANAVTGALTAPHGATIDGALTGTGVVGSVSAAGGAVMESTNTSDGTCLRLADGTQICTLVFTVDHASTPLGALFTSAEFSWSFPKPFANPPVLLGGGGSTDRWVGASSVSADTGALKVISPLAVTSQMTASALAIGRWF